MHLLGYIRAYHAASGTRRRRRAIIGLLLAGAAAAWGCTSHGPLTPEEAFRALARAHRNSDARAVMGLLSRGSLERIMRITRELSSMDGAQAEALASHLDIPADTVRDLSPAEYVLLQLRLGKRFNEDIIREASSLKIIGTDVKGDRASIRVENGMELFFVKEGPYWKFELE